MANEKIKKLYKHPFEHAYFFGWVNSTQENLPTVSIQKAILNYMNKHQISEDEQNIETLTTRFKRMKLELLESQKSSNNG